MERIALIPAYCPQDRMLTTLRELNQSGFTVIVIDDGSGAAYDAVFDKATQVADVKRYALNKGKGEALKYGLSYIKDRFKPPYTVVTADADGQHRTKDIVKISEIAVSHPDCLVLGKRDLDRSTPIKSRIGNGISRVLYRLTTGRKIVETQTGLRAFSDRLLPRFLKLPGHRYEFEIDMILNACDLTIIEETIETVYFDNNAQSHFRPLQDTVSLDKEFIRYKLPSLIAEAAGLLLFAVWAAMSGMWLLPCIGARVFSLLMKYILNKAVYFSEKVSAGRFLITSLILLICEIAAMWGLTALGVPVFAAKVLSSLLLIGVSIVVRRVFMRIKYHQ